jgi:hypothetical protein
MGLARPHEEVSELIRLRTEIADAKRRRQRRWMEQDAAGPWKAHVVSSYSLGMADLKINPSKRMLRTE